MKIFGEEFDRPYLATLMCFGILGQLFAGTEWRNMGEGIGPAFGLSAVEKKMGKCVWKSKGRCGAAKSSSGQGALLRVCVRAGSVI